MILISGSIGAVRIPLLVSQLVKEDYKVKCVLTKNAEKLIKPLSLSILSRNKCLIDDDQWNKKRSKPLHIKLSEWADILIMAPLTATTLSKWAYGSADGLVSSILIANKKPIIVAPAMNTNMWFNPAVQSNYKNLKKHKHLLLLEPSKGLLACDQFGIGKIPSNNLILLAIKFISSQNQKFDFHDLSNKSFLITGGATSEMIDPARRITNNSSGAMSLLIAQVARFRGAKLKYIHGPLSINKDILEGIESYEIKDGKDLKSAIKKDIQNYDYLVMNAAVTDIKLSIQIADKVPKDNLKDHFYKNLAIVPDILRDVNTLKKNNQKFIGFCAFTGSLENLRNIIKKKFDTKGCDLIFANPIDIVGQGFGEAADNEGWLFDKDGMEYHIEKTSKIELANKLINQIISIDK